MNRTRCWSRATCVCVCLFYSNEQKYVWSFCFLKFGWAITRGEGAFNEACFSKLSPSFDNRIRATLYVAQHPHPSSLLPLPSDPLARIACLWLTKLNEYNLNFVWNSTDTPRPNLRRLANSKTLCWCGNIACEAWIACMQAILSLLEGLKILRLFVNLFI